MRTIISLLICAAVVVPGDGHGDMGCGITAIEIKDALVRRICYEEYWRESDMKTGVSLAVEMRCQGSMFDAWLFDASSAKDYKVIYWFWGRKKGEETAVIAREGFNMAWPKKWIDEKRRMAFGNNLTVTDRLVIPRNCVPESFESSSEKELFVKAIVETMVGYLRRDIKEGWRKYPDKVHLLIANFNVDYPKTYVIVDETKNAFVINLHDTHNIAEYDDMTWIGRGMLGISSETLSDSIVTKVRKHALVKEVKL
jgi:hypothetical protein